MKLFLLLFFALALNVTAFAQYIGQNDIKCTAGTGTGTCYTNPVAVGATVIASGTTSTIFSQTTALTNGSFCSNQSGAAVTIAMTDGNNVYIRGGGAFSISGNSYTSFNDIVGGIFAGGIKISASVANAITCWFNGRQ